MNGFLNAFAFVCALLIQEKYPDHVGVVNDFAGELDAGTRAKVEAVIHGLKAKADVRLVVVTLASLEGRSVEDYAAGLAAKWGVGQKGKNNGILFVHAPKEHKARIENGYGMESRLTDIESKQILHEVVAPLTKQGKVSEGILKGTEAIAELLTRPEKAPEPAAAAAKKDAGMSVWGVLILSVALGILLMVVLASRKAEDPFRIRGDTGAPVSPEPPGPSVIPPLVAGAALASLASSAFPPSPPPVRHAPPPRWRREEDEEEKDDDGPPAYGGGGRSDDPEPDPEPAADDDSFAGGGTGGGGATEDV